MLDDDRSYYERVSEMVAEDRKDPSFAAYRGTGLAKIWRPLKRILRLAVISLCVVLPLVYSADYVSLRFRIPGHREQFGSVTVRPYYAVHLKNGKTEFTFLDPQTQVCVNSLFPHMGYSPCWYARGHTEKRIDI